MAFEIDFPEKISTCQFGPVGFEIHLPESRIHLPWQVGKCEGNTLGDIHREDENDSDENNTTGVHTAKPLMKGKHFFTSGHMKPYE